MQNFDYWTPTRLVFGKGVVEEKLQEVMSGFGKKVLLTYGGGSIKKIGLYDKVNHRNNQNRQTDRVYRAQYVVRRR